MVGSSRGGEASICMCINVYKYLPTYLNEPSIKVALDNYPDIIRGIKEQMKTIIKYSVILL